MSRPLHHVGIVVADFEPLVSSLGSLLDLAPQEPEVEEHLGLEILWMHAGETRLELLRPLHEDTRAAQVLRDGRGGIHHLGFAVVDIEQRLACARALGIPLRDEKPRQGARGSSIAFLDPDGLSGALVELIQDA